MLVTTVAACAVLAVLAAASSASVTHTCAAVATPTGLTSKVKASNITCTPARRVAKTFSTTGKAKSWKCSAKPFEGGANVTCKRTTAAGVHQAVRFQIAD